MRHALTIGGSDSSGGAGIQADLKTFAAFGVFGASAITAITAQNTRGVREVAPLAAGLVAAQIEAVGLDMRLDVVKTGMLATAAIIEAVAAAGAAGRLSPMVVDPVMVASSGARLLEKEALQALQRMLLPLAQVITPNIPEAEALSGCRIGSLDDRRRAAERIHEMGAAAVVITGGHDAHDSPDVVDLLFDGRSHTELRSPRIHLENASIDRSSVEAGSAEGVPGVHGTGCAFAAALAACLALGKPLEDAAAHAQRYVGGAIAHSFSVGLGARVLDHFWHMKASE
jgi:hydroxymethylpyrimidine/phosphomethylpyrimidine kinase